MSNKLSDVLPGHTAQPQTNTTARLRLEIEHAPHVSTGQDANTLPVMTASIKTQMLKACAELEQLTAIMRAAAAAHDQATTDQERRAALTQAVALFRSTVGA